jgi:hypothetical protein
VEVITTILACINLIFLSYILCIRGLRQLNSRLREQIRQISKEWHNKCIANGWPLSGCQCPQCWPDFYSCDLLEVPRKLDNFPNRKIEETL